MCARLCNTYLKQWDGFGMGQWAEARSTQESVSNSMKSDKLLALIFWSLIHPIRPYIKRSLYMIRGKGPTSHF